MTRQDLVEGMEIQATVVFITILGLKECQDFPRIPHALRSLHTSLRPLVKTAHVLSTIAGAIVVIRDGKTIDLDELLGDLTKVSSIGFPLRFGVTHGSLHVVIDVDGKENLIGPAVNIAARLATSPQNPGCLVHKSYVKAFHGYYNDVHWLGTSRRSEIGVPGKPGEPVFVCFVAPFVFGNSFNRESADPKLTWQHEIMIAYDLPRFGAGDSSQLRKRFERVTSMFRQLKQTAALQRTQSLLSPGGDGGVLVAIGLSLSDAVQVCERLRELGQIESRDLADAVAVQTRIGIHYGLITTYKNAEEIERPAGLQLFVADEIAGDAVARMRSGVIMTKDIALSVAGGSLEQLDLQFEPLAPMKGGIALVPSQLS